MSWLFAAPQYREPLLGAYALAAEWRALMDPAVEPAAAALKLAWWREELARLIEGSALHPITRYLAALPRAERVDFSPLGATLEAAARHIAGAPLERGAELEPHGAALGAPPLLIAARLAGAPPESEAALLGAATALGAAQYLADAIADYRREALRGRVIFAVDELLAARIEDADLAAADPPMRLMRYLNELRGRAARRFEDAAGALPARERAANRHLLVLAALGARRMRGRTEPPGAFRPADVFVAWSAARRAARAAPREGRP